MQAFDHWALGLAVFLPLIGVAVMTAVPGSLEKWHKIMAVVTTLLTAGMGVYLLARFDYGHSNIPQFQVDHRWITTINSRYHIFIDGISLPLLVLSMVTTLCCSIYCWFTMPNPRNAKAFLILMLLLETGVNGAFVAQDLMLFFVFFEVVLLPMYFLIGVWGGDRRQYAALKFFVYTMLGSAFMLLAFLGLYFFGGKTFDIPLLAANNSHIAALTHNTQLLLFGGLFIGFAIKVPLFPFHTWMPDAHTEAPTVASVLLASVLLKLGVYGFIRIALPILPGAARSFGVWIGLLAVIGIIYGALGCLAQRDMKRLIAFSSLAHMGFAMLGVATLTEYGINAAIFAMVGHGLITGTLFFLAGSIQKRLETRDLARFGGLLVTAPHLAWVLGFCAMASLGLPGLAGFWGEFLAILASFRPLAGLPLTTFRVYMVFGALGTVLAAGYLLWMYQRVAFGRPPEEMTDGVQDVTIGEYLAWAPLIIGIVALGIYPALLFDITRAAVAQVGQRLVDQRPQAPTQ